MLHCLGRASTWSIFAWRPDRLIVHRRWKNGCCFHFILSSLFLPKFMWFWPLFCFVICFVCWPSGIKVLNKQITNVWVMLMSQNFKDRVELMLLTILCHCFQQCWEMFELWATFQEREFDHLFPLHTFVQMWFLWHSATQLGFVSIPQDDMNWKPKFFPFKSAKELSRVRRKKKLIMRKASKLWTSHCSTLNEYKN